MLSPTTTDHAIESPALGEMAEASIPRVPWRSVAMEQSSHTLQVEVGTFALSPVSDQWTC